ncbi:S8 family serine peptidase [Nakamurella sp. GG22]
MASLTNTELVELMTPFDELLSSDTPMRQALRDDRGQRPAPNGPDSGESRVRFDPRDQQIASWLLRLLARMWGYDPDLDSERDLAAGDLNRALFPTMLSTSRLAQGSTIESISLDRIVTPASVVSVAMPRAGGSFATVKADAVKRLFNVSTTDQTWAIIDGGINASHPAFRSASGQDSRIVETFDLTKITDDKLQFLASGKGPIDHLVDVVQSCAVPAWRSDKATGYRKPVTSHGTHVAGILAGRVPGEFEGLCPEMQLWDFRVLSDNSEGNESRVLLALRFIRQLNTRNRDLMIVGTNMSISLGYNPKNHACGWTPVCEEVRNLVRSGVIVVAAAGNAGYQTNAPADGLADGSGASTVRSKGTGFGMISVTDPGNTEEAITVGSTHQVDPYRYGTSYFSGRGPTADGRIKPDLLAPGEHVLGPVGSVGYMFLDGTSQAAPHVSGAAAILIARYPELIGQPERIKKILSDTATDLGRDRYFQGHGLVDLLRAVQSI